MKTMKTMETMTIRKSVIDTIESNGWSIDRDGDTLTLTHDTPSGDAILIETTTADIYEDAESEYANFDTDEYVIRWLNAKLNGRNVNGKNGVPDARTLVETAEYIDSTLRELYLTLRDAEFGAGIYEDEETDTPTASEMQAALESAIADAALAHYLHMRNFGVYVTSYGAAHTSPTPALENDECYIC